MIALSLVLAALAGLVWLYVREVDALADAMRRLAAGLVIGLAAGIVIEILERRDE